MSTLSPEETGRRDWAGGGKQNKNVKSWMWEHSRDFHDGLIGDEGA